MSTKTASVAYKPQLDGLRAICILFTFLYHIEGPPVWINGSIGVDIFFALSGFLITTLLIRERQSVGRVSLKAFYIRRVFRILPMYYLAFAMTAAASYLLYVQTDSSEKLDLLEVSWAWIVSFNRELCPKSLCGDSYFGLAWTVSIEEKFYLVWPLIFVLLKEGRRVANLLLLVVFVLLCLQLPAFLSRGYSGLAFGCLSAFWYSRYQAELLGKINHVWLGLMAFGSFISLQGSHFVNVLISFAASWLVLSLYHRESGPAFRVLSCRPLAWVGKLTYGVYLFHVLVINVVVMVLEKAGIDAGNAWPVVFTLSYLGTVLLVHQLNRHFEEPLIRVGRVLSLKVTLGTANGRS